LRYQGSYIQYASNKEIAQEPIADCAHHSLLSNVYRVTTEVN
jgi:hypothetical protein